MDLDEKISVIALAVVVVSGAIPKAIAGIQALKDRFRSWRK